MTCCNCNKAPAFVRAGWAVTAVGWREADYCQPCAKALADKYPHILMTFGPPGVVLAP